MKIDVSKNQIICGDNLEWLKDLPDESIDLCYIDPPFFSNRNYEVIWGNGYELRSFGDRFSGGISHYIEWMRPRVELIHQKLKKTGSIFLHCDWHASHRLRCLMDDVFGEKNYVNEIVWKRKNGSNSTEDEPRSMANTTDSIFFYAKSNDYYFKQPYRQYEQKYIQKTYKFIDENGERYTSENLRSPSPRPKLTYIYKGYKPHENGWAVTKEKMGELDKKGLLIFPKDKNGRIRKKNYLKDRKGLPVTNMWLDIPFLQERSPERMGYKTQKPEALIRRIIESACPSNGVVLDCFAGAGTTAKAASDLGRRFIVGDVSPVAIRISAERLKFDCPSADFELKNLPNTVEGFKKVNGHKFAEMVCELMGWEVNPKKVGDGGIDGWDGKRFPIQVKNHAKATGRDDVQKFYGALASAKKKRGVFVSWEFSKQAREYIAEVKREHGVEIVAIKCVDVFTGLLIDDEKQRELESLYRTKRPATWKEGKASSEDVGEVLEKAKSLKEKSSRLTKKDATK